MSWFCSADLGIDLGSSEIRIYQRGKGLLLSEANTVLIVKNKAVAWGWEAQNSDSAAGELFCPVQQGRIIDSELTYKMLQIFFRQAGLKKITSRDRLLILVPQELSGLQRLTLSKIFRQLGFNRIYLAASVMAVALANHLKSSLVIDLGQERTDLAIVVPEGIVSGCSLAWGSRHLDQALLSYFQDTYNLNWDEKTVEC
ncbi:MAG: rod shape-determining protein, partial [Clostridia bacterium]|nr:rod shape-determining protein [Clostridia bacterium]